MQTNQTRTQFVLAISCTALISDTAHIQTEDTPVVGEQRAFLKQYCVTCHSDKLRTAGFSLENVNLSDVTQSGESLEKVVRQLRSGSMPPPSMPKPAKGKLQTFAASLENSLDQAAVAHPTRAVR